MTTDKEKDGDLMHDVLLLKCDSKIYADRITALLSENGIASRQQEDSLYPMVGKFTASTSISIFVFEKDCKKASAIIEPLASEAGTVCCTPSCPKCGSDDVELLANRRKHSSRIMILTILLFLFPGIYLGLADNLGFRSAAADYVALAMVATSVVLIVVQCLTSADHLCRSCGHKFKSRS